MAHLATNINTMTTEPNHGKHMQAPDHTLVCLTTEQLHTLKITANSNLVSLKNTDVILVINAGTSRILIFKENKT